MKSRFNGLDEKFNSELSNFGISARTEIIMKNLTEESEKLYEEQFRELVLRPTDNGWDHMIFDPPVLKPEGTYMVSPFLMGFSYKDGRVFYRPAVLYKTRYNK